MKRVLILGSTGSIGEQALDVISRSDELGVAGLSASTGWERLLEQANENGIGLVALADAGAARSARGSGWKGEVLGGEEGIRELIARCEPDVVLNAIVGSAGLGPTIVALSEGIEVALANKESLVVGGELVMALSEAAEARIVPVDSEHSALHQLIRAEPVGAVECRLTEAGRADPLLEGVPDNFRAFVGHKEAVQDLPPGATWLAASGPAPYQMLRHGNNVYATQFHPEADAAGFETRIRIYRHRGYFPPETADTLIEQVRREDVRFPEVILRNFVARFGS